MTACAIFARLVVFLRGMADQADLAARIHRRERGFRMTPGAAATPMHISVVGFAAHLRVTGQTSRSGPMVLAMAFAAGARRGYLWSIRMTLRAAERFMARMLERKVSSRRLATGYA
jgi:hypothetical protein